MNNLGIGIDAVNLIICFGRSVLVLGWTLIDMAKVTFKSTFKGYD